MNFDQRLTEALNNDLIARFRKYREFLVKKMTHKYADQWGQSPEPTEITKIPGYCIELNELVTIGGSLDAFEGPVYLVDINPKKLKEMPFEWLGIGYLNQYETTDADWVDLAVKYQNELFKTKSEEEFRIISQRVGLPVGPSTIAATLCYLIKPGIKKTHKKPGDFKTEVLINAECKMQMLFSELEFVDLVSQLKEVD